MTPPGTLRGRLFLVLAAVAILPAAVTLGAGALVLREFVLATGTAGPWQEVAVSGRALIEAVAGMDAAPTELTTAAAAHQAGLEESVRFSNLYAFLSERVLNLLPSFALGLLAAAAALALITANWLARSFSQPVEELVHWTRRLGQAEPLPPSEQRERSWDMWEFVTLREALRRTERDLDEGRTLEAERVRQRTWAEMARKVAHELKNPLTPMSMAARSVAEAGDPRIAEAGRILQEEIRRLDGMARSFSQFGRLPEGPPSTIDLGELLSTTAGRLSTGEAPVSFQRPDKRVEITGHLDALERVTRNLVANALEATSSSQGSGGAVVPVEIRLIPGEDSVEIQVLDRGPGIPPELLGRIWEPEFTTRRRGTGLGLALVRQAVEAHGGEVDAANREGGGAAFRVFLPVTHARSRPEPGGQG